MSGECDKCDEHALECVCDEESLRTISPLSQKLMDSLHCMLIHSKIPKRTEDGIVWVCNEGCNV